MSENEFDLYLSLLSRFLKLNPGQRDEIADELRDHLEARSKSCRGQGSRETMPFARALEEFGGAAELAQHFTEIAHRRKRRFIMRCTVASVVGLTAAILIATAFWPGTQPPVPQLAEAQQPKESAKAAPAAPRAPETSSEETQNSAVEAKLKKIITLNFQDTPLHEAMQYIGEQVDVDILFNDKAFEDEPVNKDELITFSLPHTKASGATWLRLILEPRNLTVCIRDGLAIVETTQSAEHAMEVHVYNCRDLLDGVVSTTVDIHKNCRATAATRCCERPTRIWWRRNGRREGVASTWVDAEAGTRHSGNSGGLGNGRGDGGREDPDANINQVLLHAVQGPWEVDGKGGTITAFDGLLVVRNNQQAQRNVQKVLDMLREADKLKEHQRPGGKVLRNETGNIDAPKRDAIDIDPEFKVRTPGPDFEKTTQKSMTDKGVTVAVICTAPKSVKYEFDNIDREIAKYVTYRLHAKEIKVFNPDVVRDWLDKHDDWDKPEEIGAALHATYVIFVDLHSYSLYPEHSMNLYQGRSECLVSVVEMRKDGTGERIYTKEINSKYPLATPPPDFGNDL